MKNTLLCNKKAVLLWHSASSSTAHVETYSENAEGKKDHDASQKGVGSQTSSADDIIVNPSTRSVRPVDSNARYTSWTTPFSKLFGGGTRAPTPAPQRHFISEKETVIGVIGRISESAKRTFVREAFGYGSPQDINSNSQTCHFFVRHTDQPASDGGVVVVYPTGNKDLKVTDALRVIANWLSESCDSPRKLSGLIYLEDDSYGAIPKLSRHAMELLDKNLAGPNIVLATIGWDDAQPTKSLEMRHKELREQWKPFVTRGASVIRLAAHGKTSKNVSHKSEDIAKLVVTKAEEKAFAIKRSQYKGSEKKPSDKFLEDARSTDIVIPIMGPTGAGKSTLVNTVAGRPVVAVGHNLRSETAQLHPVILPHPTNPARRIVLVDTPGFDDTYVADSEILRRIATWLAQSYSANMTLAGVIYLHEISQTRMLGTARKNLDMFNKLCGDAATKNVILATTKWSEVPEELADRREVQLRDRHWDSMIKLGARLRRFTDTQESGWNIIHSILHGVTMSDIDTVEIQKELVEIRTMLPETQAGQALRYTLEELLESQRLAAAQLRKDQNSSEVRALLQDTEKKIRTTMKEISHLNIPVGQRLREWVKKASGSPIQIAQGR
ncbi:hypothetical protein H0H92_008954 [Tricholoma furcatifolium]|nr:hypothetical protein H0H92_008954 [Tricholoma furcatifolium]